MILHGSIPAGAGEAYISLYLYLSTRVYPRGRGGSGGVSRMGRIFNGLSPRARGKLTPTIFSPVDNGSIPAGAGEAALGYYLQQY